MSKRIVDKDDAQILDDMDTTVRVLGRIGWDDFVDIQKGHIGVVRKLLKCIRSRSIPSGKSSVDIGFIECMENEKSQSSVWESAKVKQYENHLTVLKLITRYTDQIEAMEKIINGEIIEFDKEVKDLVAAQEAKSLKRKRALDDLRATARRYFE